MEEGQDALGVSEPREEVISGRMVWPALPAPAEQNQ